MILLVYQAGNPSTYAAFPLIDSFGGNTGPRKKRGRDMPAPPCSKLENTVLRNQYNMPRLPQDHFKEVGNAVDPPTLCAFFHSDIPVEGIEHLLVALEPCNP